MSNGTLDHHAGKPVKNVVPGNEYSTIIFEDDATIDVPGQISSDVVGQTLLTVEGDNPPTLIFGFSQAGEAAVRTAEIPVPQEDTMSEEQQPAEGEEAAAAPAEDESGEDAAEEAEEGAEESQDA